MEADAASRNLLRTFRIFQPPEPVEDVFQLLRIDCFAGVHDSKLQTFGTGGVKFGIPVDRSVPVDFPKVDRNTTLPGSVFYRVRNEVGQYFFEHVFVRVDLQGVFRQVQRIIDLFGMGAETERAGHIPDERHDIRLHDVQRDRFVTHPAEIQQLVDQSQQPVGVVGQSRYQFMLVVFVQRAMRQQFDVSVDQGQRSP